MRALRRRRCSRTVAAFSGDPSEEGGELVYASGAAVDHARSLTLLGFWQQHSNYGRGARQLHRSLDSRGDLRPKLERVAFLHRHVPLSATHRTRRPFADALLIGLSQVAMVSDYARALLAERASASS